jgi:hypothetical protein
MTDYPAVLAAIRPGAQWTLDGEDYAGLTWLDDSPKPSKKTLDDAWPQVQYDRAYAEVEAQRRARYQSETDGCRRSVERSTRTPRQVRLLRRKLLRRRPA